MSELNHTSYITGYTDGRDESLKRLYDWMMTENREPARTYFSAGLLRNVAKEFEHRINEKKQEHKISKSKSY